jgi:hypothetical protein
MAKLISLLQLNRSLLHRQMLLAPALGETLPVIERLVAVQAQVPSPPYFGLWARLAQFTPGDLMTLRDQGVVVRAALLRSTLHWVSAADYRWMRPVIQPALERAWQGFFGARKSGIEIAPLCEAALEILSAGPVSLNFLSEGLLKTFPHWNKEAMEYGVRTHLPLVQVPPAGAWKGGTAARYQLVEADKSADPQRLVRRYLAAFGPASAADVAAWAGYSGIRKTMEAMAEELVAYRSEDGRTLYDLPGVTLAEGPVPIRFVAELDNLILAHADRSRIVPELHRKKVFLTAGRVLATILIDGFVGGVWKVEREKKVARLRIELFAEPKAKLRRQIESSGEELLHFAEPDYAQHEVDVRWIV